MPLSQSHQTLDFETGLRPRNYQIFAHAIPKFTVMCLLLKSNCYELDCPNRGSSPCFLYWFTQDETILLVWWNAFNTSSMLPSLRLLSIAVFTYFVTFSYFSCVI